MNHRNRRGHTSTFSLNSKFHSKCRAAWFVPFVVLAVCQAVGPGANSVRAEEAPQVATGQPADPTQLSPQITELLQQLQPASGPTSEIDGQQPAPGQDKEEEQAAVVPIRLKGLILRGPDQGTAVLEVAEGQYVRVPLERGNARTEPHRLSLEGQVFEVESFGPVSLTLRNVENGQLRIIH